MEYAFEMHASIIIYIMSDKEMEREISFFIQERVLLVFMVRSFIYKISIIKLDMFLVTEYIKYKRNPNLFDA
jgi:hypothetical protein